MLHKIKSFITQFGRKPRQSRKDIVIVFPFDGERILLIKEYRKSYDMELWKFVSGGVDKEGKTTEEIAQEELAEEMQMQAHSWSKFYQFDTKFSSVNIHYFIAEGVDLMENPPENPDEDDVITDSKWVNLEELWAMVDNHELVWKESVLVAINFLRGVETSGVDAVGYVPQNVSVR